MSLKTDKRVDGVDLARRKVQKRVCSACSLHSSVKCKVLYGIRSGPLESSPRR